MRQIDYAWTVLVLADYPTAFVVSIGNSAHLLALVLDDLSLMT